MYTTIFIFVILKSLKVYQSSSSVTPAHGALFSCHQLQTFKKIYRNFLFLSLTLLIFIFKLQFLCRTQCIKHVRWCWCCHWKSRTLSKIKNFSTLFLFSLFFSSSSSSGKGNRIYLVQKEKAIRSSLPSNSNSITAAV